MMMLNLTFWRKILTCVSDAETDIPVTTQSRVRITTLFTLTRSMVTLLHPPSSAQFLLSPGGPNRAIIITFLLPTKARELVVVNGFIPGPGRSSQLLLKSKVPSHKELMVNFLNVLT